MEQEPLSGASDFSFFFEVKKIGFRKNGGGQMNDVCISNGMSPSVFSFLVGKLHFLCLKIPAAKVKVLNKS